MALATPTESSVQEMVEALDFDDASTMCESTCATVKSSNVPSRKARILTIMSTDSLQASVGSVNGFLNRFMYPLRGLIYAALLVASFLDPVDGVNAMERSDQLQRILELAPAGSVSMEEVENVLNDTRIEIPRLVQPAKEIILSFMDHVAMTNSDRLTTNEVLGMLGFSVWHLQQVRVVWMTILHYMNLDKDVAVVIMDSFTLINIFDPVWLYSLAHGNAVVHGEVETGEAGGSEGSHVTDYTAPLSNASSSDVAVQFPTGADSGESNESSGPDVASFVEFYENN